MLKHEFVQPLRPPQAFMPAFVPAKAANVILMLEEALDAAAMAGMMETAFRIDTVLDIAETELLRGVADDLRGGR